MPETITRYKCNACGWVYDPRFGDPANEIARGIPYEKLPDKFRCGVCGCGKDRFIKHDEIVKK